MSNYVKATNFYAKDALLSGDPDKIIKGAEIDDEYNAIATAIATKANLNSPNFTGTPTVPTAPSTTNTTQAASTAYVTTALANAQANVDITGGTIDGVDITGGTVTGITDLLPADGGTGVSSLTAKSVIIGNGTDAVTFVAPGTSGNVLTSNGTDWTSAPAATGITPTTGSAPYYGARAFVNFNGGSATIRAAGNVSSVTRNGAGVYTINFNTAMPDADYTVLVTTPGYSTGSSEAHGGIYGSISGGASLKSTTQVQVFSGDSSVAGFIDCPEMNVVVFR